MKKKQKDLVINVELWLMSVKIERDTQNTSNAAKAVNLTEVGERSFYTKIRPRAFGKNLPSVY